MVNEFLFELKSIQNLSLMEISKPLIITHSLCFVCLVYSQGMLETSSSLGGLTHIPKKNFHTLDQMENEEKTIDIRENEFEEATVDWALPCEMKPWKEQSFRSADIIQNQLDLEKLRKQFGIVERFKMNTCDYYRKNRCRKAATPHLCKFAHCPVKASGTSSCIFLDFKITMVVFFWSKFQREKGYD